MENQENENKSIVKVIIIVIVILLSIASVMYSNYVKENMNTQLNISTNKNPVTQVIDDKIGEAQEIIEEQQEFSEEAIQEKEYIQGLTVDEDLTDLSGNILLTEFTNISYFPNEYAGKTIKVEAMYYSEYIEVFGDTIHCILMMDETNCCQAMLEIKIQEGLEIPEVNSNVLLVGRIGEYQYENQTFYRLNVFNIVNV